ncbi:MAG: iron-sulfur cluster assembly scaffold protein [Acidobacteriota bacterium]
MDVFGPNSARLERPAKRGAGYRDYTAQVLDHYENPRNVGELENPDAVAWVQSPVHSDQLKLTLRIIGGVIAEARFRAFGCGAAIASSSMATVLLEGRSLEEAARLTRQEVSEALGGLPQSKLHCSVLAEEAVRRALADYSSRSQHHPAPRTDGRGKRR